MNENALEEGLKDIHYMKGKAPIFEMPAYNIKSGNRQVKTGEQIHAIGNEMYNWLSSYHHLSMVFFHFTMRIETYFLIH